MKQFLFILLVLVTVPLVSESLKQKKKIKSKPVPIENKLIDYGEFRRIVNRSEGERETHRLTENQFLKLMSEDGVILLDARSENRFKLLHIKGAKNLPFTEFTKESLADLIPEKKSKILIYCNNNFEGNQEAFAAKSPAASLNLSTYNSLKAYGYESIFELGPLLDVKTTILPLESQKPEKVETP
ncbi:rhodanese-like domain-containing protein [Leptospira brenneri]|uniref:Rhodanese-like domain-containing protein n=1 Tax=Leptospira brenneri TaxID=2023182 RepID=A0A2M9Y2J1_9LEPT|nr:rhodanese-like domain-containing protein [Leptospira brenneri]PJZ45606.1 sulfurtransferase [Leptospira brenneri]TGK92099.1 rhodanese-like domain-containing protein [Leptospira brenneri]